MTAYHGVDCSACPDFENKIWPSCRLTEWDENDMCMPVRSCKEKGIWSCGCCDSFPSESMAEFYYEESDSHRKAYERMLGCKNNR